MAMIVRNAAVLVKAGRKNAPLRKALDLWLTVTQASSWTSLNDVRVVFPPADGVRIKTAGGVAIVATVFNIKGNDHRFIVPVARRVSRRA